MAMILEWKHSTGKRSRRAFLQAMGATGAAFFPGTCLPRRHPVLCRSLRACSRFQLAKIAAESFDGRCRNSQHSAVAVAAITGTDGLDRLAIDTPENAGND